MRIDQYSTYRVQPVSPAYQAGNDKPPMPHYFRQTPQDFPNKYKDRANNSIGGSIVDFLA